MNASNQPSASFIVPVFKDMEFSREAEMPYKLHHQIVEIFENEGRDWYKGIVLTESGDPNIVKVTELGEDTHWNWFIKEGEID